MCRLSPISFRLLPSHRDWEAGVLPSSMFTFQRLGFLFLKKSISWIVKLARLWEKFYIMSKGAEKEFIIMVSKVNALRKRKDRGPRVKKIKT